MLEHCTLATLTSLLAPCYLDTLLYSVHFKRNSNVC